MYSSSLHESVANQFQSWGLLIDGVSEHVIDGVSVNAPLVETYRLECSYDRVDQSTEVPWLKSSDVGNRYITWYATTAVDTYERKSSHHVCFGLITFDSMLPQWYFIILLFIKRKWMSHSNAGCAMLVIPITVLSTTCPPRRSSANSGCASSASRV